MHLEDPNKDHNNNKIIQITKFDIPLRRQQAFQYVIEIYKTP